MSLLLGSLWLWAGLGVCRNNLPYVFLKTCQYAFPCPDVPGLGLFPFLSLAPAAMVHCYMGFFAVHLEGYVDESYGSRVIHRLIEHVWSPPLEPQARFWLDLGDLASLGALVVVVGGVEVELV